MRLKTASIDKNDVTNAHKPHLSEIWRRIIQVHADAAGASAFGWISFIARFEANIVRSDVRRCSRRHCWEVSQVVWWTLRRHSPIGWGKRSESNALLWLKSSTTKCRLRKSGSGNLASCVLPKCFENSLQLTNLKRCRWLLKKNFPILLNQFLIRKMKPNLVLKSFKVG